MPLYRRLPKFGFKNFNRKEYKGINIEVLQMLAEKEGLSVIANTKNKLGQVRSLLSETIPRMQRHQGSRHKRELNKSGLQYLLQKPIYPLALLDRSQDR